MQKCIFKTQAVCKFYPNNKYTNKSDIYIYLLSLFDDYTCIHVGSNWYINHYAFKGFINITQCLWSNPLPQNPRIFAKCLYYQFYNSPFLKF